MTQIFTGKVFLVGAGPGDPDLLTVKAHRLLRQADVILHDDLVPHAILSLAGPDAEIVSVGKRCGAKGITQDELNARMIASARRGLDVVRLKNGDPAIFGRLAEELDALEAAGIPFEIVPGITAGIAAAASLHVSLTDRRTSSRVIIVTGHHAQDGHSRKNIDWSALAREDATLVVYMPGRDFTALRDEVLAAGLPPDIPAVIVSRASTPAQRVWPSTLAELAAAPRMESPSILLIGHSLARAGLESSPENSALESAIACAAAALPLRG
ncbi:MAG: uroporphyrinogen-III C-methyltransferase [Candidatus Acidiferrales bacterium]